MVIFIYNIYAKNYISSRANFFVLKIIASMLWTYNKWKKDKTERKKDRKNEQKKEKRKKDR